MKANRILIPAALVMTVMTGCKFKNTPTYFQQKTPSATPVITQLNPPLEAGGGANYITIQGENFSPNADSNKVYFDDYLPELITNSPTSIKVRRPNLNKDSITIKVVTYGALEIAKYTPYRIKSVYGYYGGFIAGREMKAVVVDKDENVYAIEKWPPYTIHKISPNGQRVNAGAATKILTDAVMTPSGKMLLLANKTDIQQKNMETGEENVWVSLPKTVSFADFDANGCLYAGGSKTDLYVVKPDLSNIGTGVYSQYNILDIRVYGGYVYVLAENTAPNAANPKMAIWKHRIEDVNGTLGVKELVLDWSTTGLYAQSKPNDIVFSADGVMYVGTDYINPIFILNPDGTQDILYKDILPGPEVRLVWGTGQYLYMTLTVAGTVKTWDMIRIDMGQRSAPYYGR